jgi:hypothetical protein
MKSREEGIEEGRRLQMEEPPRLLHAPDALGQAAFLRLEGLQWDVPDNLQFNRPCMDKRAVVVEIS